MIRKATPKDIPHILRLYKAGLEELGLKYSESLLLNKVVTSYHLAPCFLLDIDGVVGFAGFTMVTESNSGQEVMADYMFYVEPEHRNMKELSKLVGAAKDFAKGHGFPLRVEFILNNDEELKRRLLKMHGFDVALLVGVIDGKDY